MEILPSCTEPSICALSENLVLFDSYGITDPLLGEFSGHRWIPLTKGQWCWALSLSFELAWTNCWTNIWVAGYKRWYESHVHCEAWACSESTWSTSVRLKTPAFWLFVKKPVQADNKGNNKASYHWSSVRWIHKWSVDCPHEGPVMRKTLPFNDAIMKYDGSVTFADAFINFAEFIWGNI